MFMNGIIIDEKAVLAAMPDALFITDAQDSIVSTNRSAQDLLGYQAEELIGVSLDAVISRTASASVSHIQDIEQAETYRSNNEYIVKNKIGKEISVLLAETALKNQVGETIGHAYITHNIADFIEREKEMLEIKQELQGLNGALIATLQHEKEMSARLEMLNEEIAESNRKLSVEIETRKRIEEELARSNTELEQFAYVASHDLREPLRMVTSYLQLLLKRYIANLDANAQEFFGFAMDGAARMNRLINDLLDYSRVGTKGGLFAPTECNDVISQAAKNLEVAIEEKNAAITCGSLPVLMADQNQLVQLFQNLLGNAIKFCKEKTPEVHVAAKQEERYWLFSVKDNGIGIAPEHRERIFQIFQRLHTREEYEGTGIGLAVCKRIVERHGGRIWVESEQGTGTIFWFTLPIKMAY